MMERLTIGTVAKRSGLSIRMLRHYDAIGLVSPRRQPGSGYRQYTAADVGRIQAIVLLRQLGFGLREIGDLLDRTDAPLADALTLRLHALDEEIDQRARLRDTLRQLLDRLDRSEAPSLDELLASLREVTRMERINRHYTDEQLAELADRAAALGEEGMQRAQDAWVELFAEVQSLIDAGVPPTDPRAQAAADKWDTLVAAFTGGNPGIAESLNQVWSTESEIEGVDMPAMRAQMAYIESARNARS
jgi:DNA-binding transcriptional MerR regulator